VLAAAWLICRVRDVLCRFAKACKVSHDHPLWLDEGSIILSNADADKR
jgi:hypothetical protein